MPSTVKTFIEIPFSFYHKHHYPEAPDAVRFLREEHPHDFKCLVTIQVFDDDRELEFYIVREWLDAQIPLLKKELNTRFSCEMVCKELYLLLIKKFSKDREYIIKVSEDGLYAAIKEYPCLE